MSFAKKKILVVVKTYPNPSRKYQETVCVAGVLLENPPSWIRIYPVPFRDLPYDQRFKKYQLIEAEIEKNPQDSRPESFRVRPESIKTLHGIGTERNWEERKKLLLPLLAPSMCEIQRTREETQKSLGIFKPARIEDFLIEPTEKDWTDSESNILSQGDFFKSEKSILEKIPFKFKIKYNCLDSSCNGHIQGIIDWETAQLYRNLKLKYNGVELIERIKAKYLDEVCSSKKDLYFIVGNQFGGPKSFLILSVFFPPKDDQLTLSLFDLGS